MVKQEIMQQTLNLFISFIYTLNFLIDICYVEKKKYDIIHEKEKKKQGTIIANV